MSILSWYMNMIYCHLVLSCNDGSNLHFWMHYIHQKIPGYFRIDNRRVLGLRSSEDTHKLRKMNLFPLSSFLVTVRSRLSHSSKTGNSKLLNMKTELPLFRHRYFHWVLLEVVFQQRSLQSEEKAVGEAVFLALCSCKHISLWCNKIQANQLDHLLRPDYKQNLCLYLKEEETVFIIHWFIDHRSRKR